MNISSTNEGVEVDYEHYIENFEVPEVELFKTEGKDQVLDADGQSEFRSIIAKLNTIGYQSRPDIIFDVKVLNMKVGKATKQDMKNAVKKIVKIKATPMKLKYPDLGDMSDWCLVGHGDAGIKSMPDKVNTF